MNIRRFWKEEDGASAVIVALSFTAILAVMALGIDLGYAYSSRIDMQSACDFAALAGGKYLPDTCKATQEALKYVEKNGHDQSNAEVTFLEGNNKIQVYIKEEKPVFFAGAIGVDKLKVSAKAVATKAGGAKGLFPYALYSGSSSTPIPVNGSLHVSGGDVHTNDSLTFSGGSHFSVENGKYTYSDEESDNNVGVFERYDTTPREKVEYIPMPDYHDSIMSVFPGDSDYTYYGNVEEYKQANPDKVMYPGHPAETIYITDNIELGRADYWGANVEISGALKIRNFATFDKTVTISSRGMLLVKDGVNFNGNVTLDGYIVAEKNIEFQSIVLGSNYWTQSVIYSVKGNVNFNGYSNTVYGLVYVPNGEFLVRNGYSIDIGGAGLIAEHINSSSGALAIKVNDLAKWDFEFEDKNPESSPSTGNVKLVE